MNTSLAAALEHAQTNTADAEKRLSDLLAIASVSTDPAHEPDIQSAAKWTASVLEQAGLSATIIPTAGHPAVIAHAPDDIVANPSAPRVLFYGHYDVQPPDPTNLWTTPAFAPDIRNTDEGPAIFARGASDDKGQVMCFIEALLAYRQADPKLPCPVTVLIEGEEEIGSPNLVPLLQEQANQLKADLCLVSDTSMWDAPQGPIPAICYALRGLLYFDIQLQGPSRDLHSGVYGGSLPNPLNTLTHILGKLFDDQHRVTIPGYYDNIPMPSDEEKQRWDKLGFDETKFLKDVGISQPHGEANFTTLERRWSRPSCDINGLYGGFQGPGAKTVIPTTAGAKISFRLAEGQDPHRITDLFKQWLHDQDTHGLTWHITEHGKAYPVATPTDSPFVAAVSKAVENACGQAPAMIREGATIPVVADFKQHLGLDTILLGFGRNADNIHSPDEHMALSRFHLGRQCYLHVLDALAQTPSNE